MEVYVYKNPTCFSCWSISLAQAEKESAILKAEGRKEALILDAQAEKEQSILKAQAERIRLTEEAEGRAEAMLKEKIAEAKGISAINKVEPSKEALALRKMETLARLGNGRATKIIVPENIANISSLTEIINKEVKS